MNRSLTIALAVTLLAAGCGQPPTPTPTPGRVIGPPYYEPILVSWALAFREHLPSALPFDIESRTRAEGLELVGEGEADLLITSDDPPQGWFATSLGPQALALIVHADNPVRDLRLEEIRDLFAGRVSSWREVGGDDVAVQPVIPLPGEPARLRFEQAVLGEARPWPGTLLAPDPAATVDVVRQEAGAIGIVPLAAATSDVRVIRVEGVLPGDATIANGRYPLTVELVATAPEEPAGALRDFLAWIEGESLRPAP